MAKALTDTVHGYKAPTLGAAEATFFIHTATSIYALDDDGLCRYVVGVDGSPLHTLDPCVGAQYVASLDMRTPQGLVGDPRPGAHALFVGRGASRASLIKTPPITRVVQALEDGSCREPEKTGWVDAEQENAWLRATTVRGSVLKPGT
jgi:hypothetical protein